MTTPRENSIKRARPLVSMARVFRVLMPLFLFAACVFADVVASAAPPGGGAPDVVCPEFDVATTPLPTVDLPAAATAPAGTIQGSFAVSSTGAATYMMPLTVPVGRAGMQPTLAITYDSSAGDGILGMGFSVSGLSAITRCPQNMAQDQHVRGVRYDKEDAFCLDGRRLVKVGEKNGVVEYRTFPDTFTKVLAYPGSEPAHGPDTWKAFNQSGLILDYGGSSDSTPIGRKGVIRSWLVRRASDRNDNTIDYQYERDSADVFQEGAYTTEYAPSLISYTGHKSTLPNRAVKFHYVTKASGNVRTLFAGGMALKSSRQLDWIHMIGPGNSLVRAYTFAFGSGVGTGRTILNQISECAGLVCKPPTTFSWNGESPGFTQLKTQIEVPHSKLAAPMMMDFTGDGLDDLVVPTVPWDSVGDIARTDWTVTPNIGSQPNAPYFASSSLAYSESNLDSDNDPVAKQQPDLEVQPDYGTPIDYNDDGLMDILVHNVHGTAFNTIDHPNAAYNWQVLLATSAQKFVQYDTGIPRPARLVQNSPGVTNNVLSNKAASAHMADVNGDGMPDLIQCEADESSLPGDSSPGEYHWTLRLWSGALNSSNVPTGFEVKPRQIPALTYTACDVPHFNTVDLNGDGKVDLFLPDWSSSGGDKLSYGLFTYDETSDTWEHEQTGYYNLAKSDPIFVDVNGDGLLDIVQGTFGALIVDGVPETSINTGDSSGSRFSSAVLGLDKNALNTFISAYWYYAVPIDYNGDGRQDILVPLNSGNIQGDNWFVLQSTGTTDAGTFSLVDSGIPFDTEILTNGIFPAYRLGARITDVNGDGAQDVVIPVSGFFHVFQSNSSHQDFLTKVTAGLNSREPGEAGFVPDVSIQYDTLIDRSITDHAAWGSLALDHYNYLSQPLLASECVYPIRCVVGSRPVVGSYAINDGANHERHFSTLYRGGRYDRRGRGFLGFDSTVTRDLEKDSGTIEYYDANTTEAHDIQGIKTYPYAGLVTSTVSWSMNPVVQELDRVEFSRTNAQYETRVTNVGATYFVQSTSQGRSRSIDSYDLGPDNEEQWLRLAGTLSARVFSKSRTNVTDYDDYGNVLVADGWVSNIFAMLETSTTVATFNNDPATWLIGQLAGQTECSSVGDGHDKCRVTERLYAPDTNLVKREETYDPEETTHLVVVHARDDFGNIVKTTADDTLLNHRASCTSYDSDATFPYAHGNPAGHLSFAKISPGLGVQTAVVDANQLTTKWAYDGFGRMTREQRPDLTETTYALTRSKDPQDGWNMKVATTVTGGDDSLVQYDSLARPIRWWTQNAQPGPLPQPRILQEIAFDTLNERVTSRSAPASETTLPANRHYDQYTYDAVGRVLTHTSPWQAVTSYRYDNHAIVVTDPLKHVTTIQNDALGRPVTITDPKTGVLAYTYSAFGSLLTVTDPGNAVTTTWRDAYGRVKTQVDPDRGTTSRTYDGFGQMISSSTAFPRTSTFKYDGLGRMTLRQDTPGSGNNAVDSTTWTWDTAPLGVGKVAKGALSSVQSPDGAVIAYTYDATGRRQDTQRTIANESFLSTIGYDPQGRVSTVTYPQGLGVAAFAIKNEYDPHGHLTKVWDPANNSQGTVYYWKLTGTDGAGRSTGEALGNGFNTTRDYFDDKDRIKSIYTAKPSLSPVQDLGYVYDANLNVSSRHDGLQNKNKNPLSTEYFQYDELDRLTCGSFSSAVVCPTSDRYTYQSNGNLSTKPGIPGTYTYDPQHPHAVQKAGTDTFAYDLTGNQKTRSGSVVTYTPFDLPKTFTPAPGQGGVPVALDYDGNQARVRKTAGNDVTVYFDDLYERTRNTVSNAVEHRYFVYSSSGLVATVTRTPAPGAQSTTRYMHLDNLGSIDAITEATGSGYSEKRSYDAFGARRNPQWGAAVGAFTSLTKRGFTGHEGDEELGLINMKGRIFDPKVGRFLTTDPIVAHPGLGQSWNPYSYVLNNPLAYVDPSGFQEATLDSAFSSCSGCVRIDGPTTVQWSFTPIGPPPPPSNDPNETPASWPVDLKATGSTTASPPQPPADGGGGFGGATQFLSVAQLAPQVFTPSGGGTKWVPGMGGPPRIAPGPGAGLPLEAPPPSGGMPVEVPGVGPGPGTVVGEVLGPFAFIVWVGSLIPSDSAIPVEEIVPSLRPDRPLGSTVHPFYGVPKGIHPDLFDVLSDLQAARNGDAAAAARNAARHTHTLTGNRKGWTSMDILGREFNLRIIYKAASDGINWEVVDTHANRSNGLSR